MPAVLIAVMLAVMIVPAIARDNNPFSGATSINVSLSRSCPARHVLMTRIKMGKRIPVARRKCQARWRSLPKTGRYRLPELPERFSA